MEWFETKTLEDLTKVYGEDNVSPLNEFEGYESAPPDIFNVSTGMGTFLVNKSGAVICKKCYSPLAKGEATECYDCQ